MRGYHYDEYHYDEYEEFQILGDLPEGAIPRKVMEKQQREQEMHQFLQPFLRELDGLRIKIFDLENQVKGLKSGNLALENQVKELRSGNLALENQVKALRSGNLALENQVKELRSGNLTLENQVKELRSGNLALENQVKELKAGAPQPKTWKDPRPDPVSTGSKLTRSFGLTVPLGSAQTGDTVHFGPEDWLVLERRGRRLLLFCTRSVNKNPLHYPFRGSDWSSSTLRKWLNDVWLNQLYQDKKLADMKLYIEEVDINKPKPSILDRTGMFPSKVGDRVFVLSKEEIKHYGLESKVAPNGLTADMGVRPAIVVQL